MAEATHIIQKLFVEVDTSDLEEANRIKNNIDLFLENEVLPEVEIVLQKYNNPKLISRIRRMELNLEVPVWENKSYWKTEIINQIQKQVELQLKSATYFEVGKESEGLLSIPETKNNEDVFLFFLENGYLPWYGTEKRIVDFEQNLIDGRSFVNALFRRRLSKVLDAENSVARLVNQFNRELIVLFLTELNQGLRNKKIEILSILKSSNNLFVSEWLKVLLSVSIGKSVETTISDANNWFLILQKSAFGWAKKDKKEKAQIFKLFLAAIPENILSNIKFQGMLNQSLAIVAMEEVKLEFVEKILIQKQKGDALFLGETQIEIAVQNAGLILLHPFFKSFFRELKFIDSNWNIKPKKMEIAVQMLHFLATGQENVFEANLVFEKFLCGLSMKMPIRRESLLTKKMKYEAENLLQRTIKYWPALKNTSPDGLRQMFFKREGKLIQKEKKIKLIVERKAQDALLEKLNWNVSVIKIPWIEELLYVDW